MLDLHNPSPGGDHDEEQIYFMTQKTTQNFMNTPHPSPSVVGVDVGAGARAWRLARGLRLRFCVVGSVRVVLCLCLHVVFIVSVAETSSGRPAT